MLCNECIELLREQKILKRNTYENDRCKHDYQPRKTVSITVDGFYPRLFVFFCDGLDTGIIGLSLLHYWMTGELPNLNLLPF